MHDRDREGILLAPECESVDALFFRFEIRDRDIEDDREGEDIAAKIDRPGIALAFDSLG